MTTPIARPRTRKMMTIPEVAAYTQLSEKTVRRMIARGDLKAIRIRSRWRIHQEDLEACLAQAANRLSIRVH